MASADSVIMEAMERRIGRLEAAQAEIGVGIQRNFAALSSSAKPQDLHIIWEKMMLHMEQQKLAQAEAFAAARRDMDARIFEGLSQVLEWMKAQEVRWTEADARLSGLVDRRMEEFRTETSSVCAELRKDLKADVHILKEQTEKVRQEATASHSEHDIAKVDAQLNHAFQLSRDMSYRICALEEQVTLQTQRSALGNLCSIFQRQHDSLARKKFQKWRETARADRAIEQSRKAKGQRVHKVLLRIKIKTMRRAHHQWRVFAVAAKDEEEHLNALRARMIASLMKMLTRPVRSAWTQWRRVCLLGIDDQESGSEGEHDESCDVIGAPTVTNGQERTMRRSMVQEVSELDVQQRGAHMEGTSSFEKSVRQHTNQLRNAAVERSLMSQLGAKSKGTNGGTSLAQKIAFLGTDLTGQIQVLGAELQLLEERDMPRLQKRTVRAVDGLNRRITELSDNVIHTLREMMAPAIGNLQVDIMRVSRMVDELLVTTTTRERDAQALAQQQREVAHAQQAHVSRAFEELGSRLRGIEKDLLPELSARCFGVETEQQALITKQSVWAKKHEATAADIELLEDRCEKCEKYVSDSHDNLQRSMVQTMKKFQAMLIGPRKPDMVLIIEAFERIEDHAYKKTYVGPTPQAESGTLGRYAADCARFIAETADLEGLQKILCGSNADALTYCEDELQGRREELQTEMDIALEVALLDAIGEARGAVRQEAREKTRRRIREAVDVALSKYDQVLLDGSTRIGRIKATIPTCVACDRPLRNKVRRGREAPTGGTINPRPRPPTPAENKPRSGRSEEIDPEQAVISNIAGAAEEQGDVHSGPYILRGGFRMPKNEPGRVFTPNPNPPRGRIRPRSAAA